MSTTNTPATSEVFIQSNVARPQTTSGNRGTSAQIFGESFDGSTPVNTFLGRFERHCDHYRLSGGQKVNMLPLCLSGYVEVWFNNLIADPDNSNWTSRWFEWKNWLLQEFGGHDTEDDLIDALRAYEPIDGEHILDFNFRFKVCASAVSSCVLSDKLKISQYLEAAAVKLLNEDAVTYCKLQDQGLKTLKNTMDNAIKYFKALGNLIGFRLEFHIFCSTQSPSPVGQRRYSSAFRERKFPSQHH